jgi:hypothetical protein
VKATLILAALLITSTAQATTWGVHVGSIHVPAKESDNNANYGLYARTDSGLTFGVYRNTLRRTSLYAGYTFNAYRDIDVTVGGITGYQLKDGTGYARGAVTGLVAFSYPLPVRILGMAPRVSLVPGHLVKARSVLHLTMEF